MSSRFYKVNATLKIGSTTFSVQNATVSYAVDTLAVATIYVAPSKRRTSDYKFSVDEVVDQVVALNRMRDDAQEAVVTGTIEDKSQGGGSSTVKRTIFRGYISMAAMSMYLGSFSIVINLVSSLADTLRGNTNVLSMPTGFLKIDTLKASGIELLETDVLKKFTTVASSILDLSTRSKQGINEYLKNIHAQLKIALDFITKNVNITKNVEGFHLKTRSPMASAKFSHIFSISNTITRQSSNFHDALMATLEAYELQFVTYIGKNDIQYEVWPRLATVKPFDDSYSVPFERISGIQLSDLQQKLYGGAFMNALAYEHLGMENVSLSDLVKMGIYEDPKVKNGELFRFTQPIWLATDVCSGDGAGGAADIKNVNTSSSSPVAAAARPTSSAGNTAQGNYVSAREKYANDHCQYMYYKKKYENRQLEIDSVLNFDLKPGFCYRLDYSKASSGKYLVGYIKQITHSLGVSPDASAATHISLSHVRDPSESDQDINSLLIYQ